jgi:hypothetical protein
MKVSKGFRDSAVCDSRVLAELRERITFVERYIERVELTRNMFMKLACLNDPDIEFCNIALAKMKAVLPLALKGDLSWIDQLKAEGEELVNQYKDKPGFSLKHLRG